MFVLLNSLRIALLACLINLVLGLWLAEKSLYLGKKKQLLLEAALSLPLVLPPTVLGFLLLLLLGPRSFVGALLERFGVALVMNWQAALIASTVVSFPLLYRSALAAFRSFDKRQIAAARCLGKSRRWIFFELLIKGSKHGLCAGAALCFARALGEYGATQMMAGYIPGKTATISTTIYQLWRAGDMGQALIWVLVNVGISIVILSLLSWQERRVWD